MTSRALSCGILVFNRSGEVLLGHSSGSPRWDIPKGLADRGETPMATALRETAEETGLQFAPAALIEVGRFGYLRGKDLELFAALVGGLDPARCVCTSFFRDSRGRERPELDAFRWVSWAELPTLCGRSLAALLATIDPALLVARCAEVPAEAVLAMTTGDSPAA